MKVYHNKQQGVPLVCCICLPARASVRSICGHALFSRPITVQWWGVFPRSVGCPGLRLPEQLRELSILFNDVLLGTSDSDAVSLHIIYYTLRAVSEHTRPELCSGRKSEILFASVLGVTGVRGADD